MKLKDLEKELLNIVVVLALGFIVGSIYRHLIHLRIINVHHFLLVWSTLLYLTIFAFFIVLTFTHKKDK